MSFQNLTRHQNKSVAALLTGVAKTVFVACVIAALFPPSGQPRPIAYAAIGMALSAVIAGVGVALDRGDEAVQSPRRKRR